jgi:hypothetical protein
MSAQFSYKYTTESELFSFDFNPVLIPTETIISAACTAITEQGTDTNPSAILSGAPAFVNGKATQRVIAGQDDTVYRLIMTVNTSLGNTYTCVGDIPVYSPATA